MDITYPPFKARKKEAAYIKKSIDNMIEKYGFDLVKYVANRMFEKKCLEKKLEKQIVQAEEELSELKEQRM